MVDYASSKGAIVGFTRALAKNLLPKGIRVNGVAYVFLFYLDPSMFPLPLYLFLRSHPFVYPLTPNLPSSPGPVHTPIQPASRPPEQMEDFGKKSQLGRAGQPSEIAPTYVFLASGESELYYGQVSILGLGGVSIRRKKLTFGADYAPVSHG